MHGKYFNYTNFTSEFESFTKSEIANISESVQLEELSEWFYLFSLPLLQLDSAKFKKNVFPPVLSLRGTTLIIKKEIICTMHHTSIVFGLKKQGKKTICIADADVWTHSHRFFPSNLQMH